MQAMEISRSALDVEWRRLDVIAENLANMNTAVSGHTAPYRELSVISGPKTSFAAHLEQGRAGEDKLLSELAGVAVLGIEASTKPPRLVREPGNPNANADGYVSYPAIDHAAQMTLMIKTSRAYEANIVAINAAHQMYTKALDLGRRG